jgi:hypothetical protein
MEFLEVGITDTDCINFGSEQEPMAHSFERGYGVSDTVKAKNFMAS